MSRTTWSFSSAGQLTFGRGAVEQLGELVARRGLRRVLLVTDPQLVALGLAERVRAAVLAGGLADAECQVFAGGEAEPTVAAAEAAIAAAREFRPDVLLGLGGGSNMDLAKVAAASYSHGGHPRDYFGFDQVPGPVLPLICLPTTAGTGSEVSHAAVVTDTEQAMKVSTLSPYLRPTLAVVDPQLTDSCPPQVTADSGIDALTHAIEAATAVDFDKLPLPPGERCAYEGRYPLGEAIAEQAIELIGRHLVRAVQDPDPVARDGMALAATLAGLAFSNCGVALVHALEYPLGGAVHCSHGAGNGLLLPYVMRFNSPLRRATLARIARLLGRDTEGLSDQQAAEIAIEEVEQLRVQIGIPTRIRELGATFDQLPEFADKAHAIQRLRWVNPRPATRDELLQILQEAF